MRARSLLRAVAVVLALASSALAAACVDLFHETSFDTLCTFDASAPGCAGDAPNAVVVVGTSDAGNALSLPLDICTLDTAAAYAAADHACAWLSACAGSIGGNAPGECLLHAREAFDCRVAPDRLARGSLLDAWRCLATASTCDAVGACIEPGGAESCPITDAGAFVACATTTGAAASAPASPNAAVRIACSGTEVAPTAIESCITSGQTCAVFAGESTGASCGGPGVASGASSTCAASGCTGAVLSDCDTSGVDRGIDCTNVGAGACTFDRDAGVGGCVVTSNSSADAGPVICPPTSVVTCDADGVAHGCPTGIAETVDCAELTGSAACDPAASGRAWDVARACSGGGSCSEVCTNGVITACVGRNRTTLDCKAQGLSGCGYTVTGAGASSENHPACVR